MNRKRFWPDPWQELLLGLCLYREPDAAVRCWTEWKARIDLDDLDHASFPLMSLVYPRLRELGIADAELGRIKGLHRYRWTQSQLAARGRLAMLKALGTAEIPTMLAGGAALAATAYPDPAARGMQDTEIVVPFGALERAVRLLESHGWLARNFDPVRTPEWFAACALLHPEHGETWLRWRPFNTRRDSGEDWWEAAEAFQYEDTATRVPCAADQFLRACERGMDPAFPASLQWLADSVFLIRRAAAPLDWKRLADQARRHHLALQAREALEYLRQFEKSIPGDAIAGLARIAVPLDARIEYHLAGRPAAKQGDLTHKFGNAACRYLRMQPGERLGQFFRDVPRVAGLLRRSG
jgi:hypothetical protein